MVPRVTLPRNPTGLILFYFAGLYAYIGLYWLIILAYCIGLYII
jgi:hypothetical protein